MHGVGWANGCLLLFMLLLGYLLIARVIYSGAFRGFLRGIIESGMVLGAACKSCLGSAVSYRCVSGRHSITLEAPITLSRRLLVILSKESIQLVWQVPAAQQKVTVVPSSAGSSNFHSHFISFLANMSNMTFAIPSKFSVARANIVGPAPDRHMPQRPG